MRLCRPADEEGRGLNRTHLPREERLPHVQAAKEGINPRTYCHPSGIDLPHFMQALEESTPQPADVAGLPRPILGYWGAVDERIDFALLEAICRRRPDASVVLLGPRVGMSP